MSILKTIPIALDLKRVGAQAQALPTLVEGDNGNVFVITLTDDGEPLDLSNATRVICVFSKTSDGKTVEQDTDDGSVVIGGTDHNVITITLKAGSYGAGTNNCEVQIYSGVNSDVLVTTANFNFRGRKGIMNDETIQSEDKYPILVSLIQQVTAALAAALPYTNVTASAALLPPGSTATASVTVGEDSAAFAFGIPEAVEITSVALISGDHSPGTTDVYRMSLSDGTHVDFGVYNGADGEGSPGTSLPKALGTASAGSAVAYSREDHVHPMPGADDIPTDSVGVTVQDALDDLDNSKAETATYTATIGTTWDGADAVHEATGAIVEFVAEESMALVDLSVDINAVQNLNGYDYPWGGGCRKNICPPFEKGVSIDPTTGAIGSKSTSASTGKIPVNFTQNPSYYVSGLLDTLRTFIAAYNASDEFLGRTAAQSMTGRAINSAIFTSGTPSGTGDIAYVRITIYEYSGGTGVIDDIDNMTAQLEIGSSATSYEPYANICPISGHAAATVTRCGKNMANIASIKRGDGSARTGNEFISLPAGTYTMSANNVGDCSMSVQFWSSNNNIFTKAFSVGQNSYTITLTDDIVRLYCYISTADYNNGKYGELTTIQIETGSSPTAYEPYNGNTYTIDLDGTRYGGSLDVTTGVLTVDRAYAIVSSVMNKTEDANGYYWYSTTTTLDIPAISGLNAELISDRFVKKSSISTSSNDGGITFYANNIIRWKEKGDLTLADYRTYLTSNPFQICYELATPLTVQLTAEQVDTLVGQNVIWADSGDVDVQYKVTSSPVPYSQVVSVSGLLATDNPIVDIVPSDTYATAETQLEAWGSIYRIVTGANQITVYATEETSVSIPIQLKCVR